uniref:Retrovirus-related Pol polyprotein from transposon TNT 1-94 n=1 Tax=Tanacetum cinerariifolium TaxID=118510 RepID=A0A699GLN8_TANCI|nr:retrovirus-related Pol polyprotein from transposon TNT 1-94 [Tanacetum cinerariifolium]
MTGNRAVLTNFVEKFLGTVRFGNNDFAVIAGYGDVVIGSMTIKKVYYFEGLVHNLFSVGQFCDKGLEVAFRKSTCFVQTEDGVDFLTRDRSSNLYTIALNEVASNYSACLLAKASSLQSWLWHQRLSHLNFVTINNLVKNNLVQGLPKIHQKHHKSKTAFASNKPLYLLHMDLCGPMRVESINRKRFVLVIVDDYSRYTWAFFIHSKDEASDVIISFIKKTQVNLQLQVQRVRTDNGTEFKKTLAKFFDEVRISQQFFATRMPQQNAVVERRNRTLVEAARIMLTFANLPLFLWAAAIIFKESAAFEIYNKRTRKIHESVNVNFDEILEMASKQFSLELGLTSLNETRKSLNLTVSQVSEASKKDLEDLFQKFYDEYFDSSKLKKSLTTNVETSINEKEVFHEVSESFQGKSSSSSLNDDVQQSLEEVILPQTNTYSISNDMIPNADEANTSHNVFNVRLKDAYFDANTSFHDLFNVHPFYQSYPHDKKWTKDHPVHKIIGDPQSSVRTRGQLANSCLFSCLLSFIEPANVAEALRDADWVSAMQYELDQFSRLKVWRLVPRPECKAIIKTKWIFKNKKDESISRIKAICLFLAYAAHKDFTVFQMDVKIVFLNGILKEKVYVGQPPGFVSTQYPDHVYALEKALYGSKQAPRAWYDIVLQFLIASGFQKVPTPMVEQAKLKLDLVGKPIDHTDYQSMIGSLMYVTSSRPDIMFATCMCARYQANPNEHHVLAIKRIFRCLKGTINLGLWYPKDSSFDLTAYLDADHEGCHLDRKSTSGSVQFLGDKLVCWSSKKQNCVSISTAESEYVAVSSCCAQVLWMRT